MLVASDYANFSGTVAAEFPPIYNPVWAMGSFEYELYNQTLQNRTRIEDILLVYPVFTAPY